MLEVESGSGMIYRVLGSTGERVSAIGVGGWHLGLKHVDERLSIRIVRKACEAARTFHPLSAQETESILAKTAAAAAAGAFEPFKTTSLFDSTATNPKWLGEEPQRLQQLMAE